MLATRMDHQYHHSLSQLDNSQNPAKDSNWASRQNAVHRNMRASTPSPQSSPRLPDSAQYYAEQIPQPAQAIDFMAPSDGPYYGPYTSRASSTLPSPSPMTPNTEDMFHNWPGRRHPSDFATSQAPSLFSPRSPRDLDFPTGNRLSPYMAGSQQPCANLFGVGFDRYQTLSYPGQEQLTLDTKSDMTMSGPPYPTQIVDHHGLITTSYLDPHVLHPNPEENFPEPQDGGVLPMNYISAEFETPSSDGVFHGAPDQNDYGNTNSYAIGRSNDGQKEDTRATHHQTKNSIISRAPTHHAAQHRKPSQQLKRRSSNQIRPTSRPQNQCPICHTPFDSSNKLRKHNRKEHIRPYPCIFALYGCNSVFGTKNEWSRHVKVQHLRLETWRCNIDECEKYVRDEDHQLLPPASKGKSEYDRKDLFLNHVRRCHKDRYPKPGVTEGPAATTYEEEAQQRCHMTLRSPPPQSLCRCCPDVIWPDFDARLEHLGRTMESDEEARASFHDQYLESYMIQEELLCQDGGRWLLTGAEGKKGGRQARRPPQRSLPTQAPLPSTAGRHEPSSIQPSRKSKRVAQKMQQLNRQAKEEENSEDDAEAETDDECAA